MCEHLLLKQPQSKRNELNYPGRPTSEEVVAHPTEVVVAHPTSKLGSVPPSTAAEKCSLVGEEDGMEEELEVTTVIQVCK